MDLKDLENCKKGQDCYILACGPSLNKYDNKETRDKGISEIIIGKQRNGEIGTIKLTFLGQFARFENYVTEENI